MLLAASLAVTVTEKPVPAVAEDGALTLKWSRAPKATWGDEVVLAVAQERQTAVIE